MIGNFARMTRGPPRAGTPEVEDTHDTPPEGFVDKVSDEGGDVYLSPILDTLRAALRARRSGAADPSPSAPEPTNQHDASGSP